MSTLNSDESQVELSKIRYYSSDNSYKYFASVTTFPCATQFLSLDGGQSRELYFTYTDCDNKLYLGVFDLYYAGFEYEGPINRYVLDFIDKEQSDLGSIKTVKIFGDRDKFFIAGHTNYIKNGNTQASYSFTQMQTFVALFDTSGTS